MDDPKSTVTYDRGCVVRGPRDRKRIALEFTGGSFAEGGETILNELQKRGIKGSFFFTGDFYRTAEFKPLIERIRDEGHYVGPHSDSHPLYASWEDPPKLLISRREFDDDLTSNLATMERFGIDAKKARFFIPPYEHWTPEISEWTRERGMVLINLTRGTKSHTDYMEDEHPRFVPAKDIMQSIFDHEAKDPDGLNGFLLLLHIGAGPKRTKDKSFHLLDELLDELTRRGYSFVRVDEMLEGL